MWLLSRSRLYCWRMNFVAPWLVLILMGALVMWTTRLAGMFLVGAVASFGRVALLKLAGERLVARLRTQTFAALLAKGASATLR